MADFIQQYLDAQLFNIADNEERLQKLQGSAASLAAMFANDKAFVVQFLRGSLLEKVDEESPALSRIEEHIKADWPTFRSAQRTRPIAILLAVGWQALRQAIEETPELSSLVWYGSANLLIFKPIDSLLAPVLEFLRDQGDLLERRAEVEWSPYASKITKRVKSIAIPEMKLALQQSLLKASAATDGATAIEGGNPNNPASDGTWGVFFAKSAAAAVNTALNHAAKAVIESTQSSFDDLNDKVTQVSAELVRSHTAQSRRTELLWLSESKYSPRLKKGYSALSASETVIALTVDMAAVSTGVAPQSVEHFLAATVRKSISSDGVNLETFVRDIAQSQLCAELPQEFFSLPDGVRRLGLLEFIGALRTKLLEPKHFSSRTGFAKATTMNNGDLARWLYREIKCVECIKGDLWE